MKINSNTRYSRYSMPTTVFYPGTKVRIVPLDKLLANNNVRINSRNMVLNNITGIDFEVGHAALYCMLEDHILTILQYYIYDGGDMVRYKVMLKNDGAGDSSDIMYIDNDMIKEVIL